MSKYHPKIAIIGAGPSGLTLARILLQKGITATVFEREDGPNARTQGGTLDLHPQSGQQAIKEAGLYDEFLKVSRPEGEDFILMDKTGHRHLEEFRGSGSDRPEIDRFVLRQLLLDSLPDGMVQWGSHLQRVEKGTLYFENRTLTSYDLIVGADGAWSKVRPALSDIKPHYVGIAGIYICISNCDERFPALGKLVGRGSLFALSAGKAIVAQRNGDLSIKGPVWQVKPETWLKDSGLADCSNEEAKALMLTDFDDWCPELKDIIRYADPDFNRHNLYTLPIDMSWENVPGVTAIGDSGHLMAPFSGQGVNLAMRDALDLAHAIVNGKDDLIAAVKAFELVMFERAKEEARGVAINRDLMCADDAPVSFAKAMQEMMEKVQGEGLVPVEVKTGLKG
ncbi:MAG: hypothetical protein M1835_006331 [Candelina submexicana]|nr:MAG: hypothetical protein M1835_006331 [Candelina submexicana]